MRRFSALLAILAGPALAGGLEIEVIGETVSGTIQIDLLEEVAPLHAAQISALAEQGAYDGVVFHRVIEGFMAQTGDVRFGKNPEDMSRAGMGGSDLGNIQAEFSDVPFDRGVVGMARSLVLLLVFVLCRIFAALARLTLQLIHRSLPPMLMVAPT